MENKSIYWASTENDELVAAIHSRCNEYYNYIEESGLYAMWSRSYLAYFGSNLSSSSNGSLFDATSLKQQGAITRLKSNHYRNVLKHTLQLATSQKPAFACRATNSDYKSQAQTILGNGLVDYYLREKKLGRAISEAVERGLVFSEGWVHSPWNTTGGEVYDVHPDTQAPIHEGDLNYSVHSPLDVIRDTELEDSSHEWLILREYQNKWNLAAKYDDVRDEILGAGSQSYEDLNSFNFNISQNKSRDNRIPVYTMYHSKTEAMPQGRLVVVAANVILFDGPLPYRKIPLYCLKPDTLLESPFGYTPAFELLGIQQGIDVLSTAIMTNNAANSVQNIWSQKGDDISVRELTGGMKHIQSENPPQPINLTRTAPETFNFRQQLIGEMETLSGISSTVRGNPESNLKSGSALALVVSQSIQFASLLEQSYNELLEDLGTAIIDNLRDFSKTPRVAAILGESSRPFQKEFTGDDLSQINRVVVEQTSPLSKTISGRVEIANQLLQQGMIETPKQYITVLTTGQLDPAIEGSQHAMLNIRSENEDLRNGLEVQAVITENHADHIREHKNLIENPEAKRSPELVASVLNHIQEHLELWRSADTAILMITSQELPPPSGRTPPIPPQQGPGIGSATIEAQGAVPQDQMPNQPNMPGLPEGADPVSQAAYDKYEGGKG